MFQKKQQSKDVLKNRCFLNCSTKISVKDFSSGKTTLVR